MKTWKGRRGLREQEDFVHRKQSWSWSRDLYTSYSSLSKRWEICDPRNLISPYSWICSFLQLHSPLLLIDWKLWLLWMPHWYVFGYFSQSKKHKNYSILWAHYSLHTALAVNSFIRIIVSSNEFFKISNIYIYFLIYSSFYLTCTNSFHFLKNFIKRYDAYTSCP